MCHEQFHRTRIWDREDVEAAELTDDEPEEEEWHPSFLSEDEPDEDIEILTDGGD